MVAGILLGIFFLIIGVLITFFIMYKNEIRKKYQSDENKHKNYNFIRSLRKSHKYNILKEEDEEKLLE